MSVKPDDIPQDVWDAAGRVPLPPAMSGPARWRDVLQETIARATLAERDAQRERDAKIADDVGNSYGDDETGWAECSEVIARNIRKGGA